MVELDDRLAQAIRGTIQARREDAVSLLQELVRVTVPPNVSPPSPNGTPGYSSILRSLSGSAASSPRRSRAGRPDLRGRKRAHEQVRRQP
jgi:hypothetical protein